MHKNYTYKHEAAAVQTNVFVSEMQASQQLRPSRNFFADKDRIQNIA